MAPSAILPDDFSHFAISKTKYNDWRDDLEANGFVVLKSVISPAKAVEYQKRALEWLSSFGSSFDISNPETWTKENLPVVSDINTFRGYALPHEKFMWDARLEKGVVGAFEKMWGTNELLVSFDSLNITLPNRKDKVGRGAWQHIDQSPLRRGRHCVQGIINLSHAGPEDGGLLVYPGSHKLVEKFFDTETDKSSWLPRDFYQYTPAQLDWFLARGIKPQKVCAEPGDLILWDSRTIHQGCEPSPSSTTIRTVIYATYTPASLANKEALETKANIFKKWGGTTHWPHDNIVDRDNKALLEDGTRDPRDRDEPIEKPELTAELLKLAGVESY